MISNEEVESIAKLARLELSDKEIRKMQKDLSSVLDYFDILNKAPITKASISKISPVVRTTGLKENIVRADEIRIKNTELAKNLIRMSPDQKDGYIKVKNIF